MSAEISTLVQPAELSLGILNLGILTPARPVSSPESTFARAANPVVAQRPALEPVVDLVLQFLWVLVGVYVWIVLLVKGSERRDASRELVPIVWPEVERPALGLPAVGLVAAPRIR